MVGSMYEKFEPQFRIIDLLPYDIQPYFGWLRRCHRPRFRVKLYTLAYESEVGKNCVSYHM